MQIPDVNVLVNAHREDSVHHEVCADWVRGIATSQETFGFSDLVASSVLRILTNRSIYPAPTPMAHALSFVNEIRNRPNCYLIEPGVRHWEIFTDLCRTADVKGGLVTDAYLAALAIESGSEWVSMDGDFARFPGLRWRRPTD